MGFHLLTQPHRDAAGREPTRPQQERPCCGCTSRCPQPCGERRGAAAVRYRGLFVIKTGLKTVQFNFCLGFSCCPILKAVRWTLWCLTAAVKGIFLDWRTEATERRAARSFSMCRSGSWCVCLPAVQFCPVELHQECLITASALLLC